MQEKNRAATIIKAIIDERNVKIDKEVIDLGHETQEFWDALGGMPDDMPENHNDIPMEPAKLFHLFDDNGEMKFEMVGAGKEINKSILSTNDVMVLDTGFDLFVWEGKKSSKKEREFGQFVARKYCKDFNRPRSLEVVRCKEGGENEVFEIFCSN